MSAPAITLTPELLIARGGHRSCYQHPENDSLCIKIHHQTTASGLVETERELRYYHFIKNKHIDNPAVAQYYGTVTTNLGLGFVYERITSSDNNESKTLATYLHEWSQIQQSIDWLDKAWLRFKKEAQQGWLITRKLHPYNLVVREDETHQKQIVVVDNLGSSAFFPVVYFSHRVANAELEKRFSEFSELIEREYHYTLDA
ncbi:hypothetical protein TUM12370_09590 [Salmonella enterica subsp. enterica serovar Choleraesuis]|nr:hypothetical protein TUM12370_09590 [Salmonella enterica subsp. enterica serovar Choleraesuis]